MITFKSKSLTPNKTDWDIQNGCHSINFISFERAIKETDQFSGIKTPVIGYRVTEQGIEIIRG
jgi:hypothetical protein